jgi:GxxExxY protein
MAGNLIYPDESYAIRGACMAVYREMGAGFLEAVYQECLAIEFARCGIPYVTQKPLALSYRGQLLQQVYRPDFICYDKIILEIKALTTLAPEHKAQVMNYLKTTQFELGFLVNFGHHPQIEIMRIANSKTSPNAISDWLISPDTNEA